MLPVTTTTRMHRIAPYAAPSRVPHAVRECRSFNPRKEGAAENLSKVACCDDALHAKEVFRTDSELRHRTELRVSTTPAECVSYCTNDNGCLQPGKATTYP
ncbi:inorganic pyrophosphatase/exopolyphosphatase [Anopheles sinensis]|uniref:Inorganic pyrophosphatase/exopolyphosphatase n=1 Tax=Anopheles sinensis TaxID=74873 RepID=A0A084VJ02_ANOSI|nr:inorganic pyrophosphatase/exopolyphosphatase [Anopheles sinensis]